MVYLQSYLIILLEVACLYLFQDTFTRSKVSKRKIVVPIWMLLVSAVSLIGTWLLSESLILKEMFAIILFTVSLYIINRNSIKKNFWLSVCFSFLLVAADFITMLIGSEILKLKTVGSDVTGVAIVLMSKSVLLLLIILSRRFLGDRWGYATDAVDEFWYIIFPIISICVIAAIVTREYRIKYVEDIYFIWGVLFALVAMNILLMFYIKGNSEKNYLLQEKRMLEMDARSQQILYRSLEEKIVLQRRLSHDYKNHLSYIRGLLELGKYDKISDYIDKINGKLDHDLDMIDTNNTTINTVINTKYYEAKKAGAAVVFKISDLSEISMDEVDIIVLLSNLFNNCIEAVEKCQDRKVIKFKIEHERENLIIAFENTYDGRIIKEGEVYKTTKRDENELHGIGIKNVIKIVEKYGGEYRIDADQNLFRTIIMIPMERGEEAAILGVTPQG